MPLPDAVDRPGEPGPRRPPPPRWPAALLALCALLSTGMAPDDGPPPPPAHRLVVGWDDVVICCGPGTDAGMDSPEAVRRMVRRWKGRGITGLYWRVDETEQPSPPLRPVLNHPRFSPPQNHLLARHDRVFRSFPLLRVLREAAEAEGVELWAWFPTVYSNGAPAEGPGFTTAWQYESRFGHDHPEVLSVDRKGNRHYMVWEYAHPEARAAKVAEFVGFAREAGFRKFVACLRTEAGQMQPPPLHADQFGFNAPVVEEMKRRHGVDILTDPRFDFTDPARDPMDPMVENWRRLRGEYLTEFYRDLRKGLDAVAPGIEVAVQIPGDRVGSCLGNWTLDWRTWVDEGLVQEIVLGVPLDDGAFAGTDAAPEKRGYLPCAVPVETLRAYIAGSRHPGVRVIAAGGPAASFARPPAPFAGWRLDGWFDLWISNWEERWRQWREDLREFGRIRYLVQDFDGPDVEETRCDGGFGEVAHRPDLRACPGFWYPVADGSGAGAEIRPVRPGRGARPGRALRLVRTEGGPNELRARHNGSRDRSRYPFPGDTAISTGTCVLDFSLLREERDSALVVYLQDDADADNPYAVGLYVPESGTVHYRRDGGYVASGVVLGPGSWDRLSISVDLEKRTWSAAAFPGGRGRREICLDVPYRSGPEAFNALLFSSQGRIGTACSIDEVSWTWTPADLPEPPGRRVLAADGFEGAAPGTPLDGAASDGGGPWAVEAADPADLAVDSDLSLGPEVRSLRVRGGGGRAVLSPEGLRRSRNDLTLDVDVFLRGDAPVVWLVPAGKARTADRTTISLADAGTGTPLAAVRAVDGAWQCWDGDRFAEAPIPAAVDAWSRLQWRIDGRAGTWRVLLHVVGEAPRELFRGRLGTGVPQGAPLSLVLETLREKPRQDGPAFDNLRLSTR